MIEEIRGSLRDLKRYANGILSGKVTEEVSSNYIKRTDEGGNVCYITFLEEEYGLYYLTADQANPKNFTYPFQGDISRLPVILSLRPFFVKPLQPMNAEEANTLRGATVLYKFYPGLIDYYKTKDTPPEEELFDEGGYLLFRPFPALLGGETGTTIKGARDYVNALEKLYNKEFPANKRDSIAAAYTENQASLFLYFLLYEFSRTERYETLKEDLAKYSVFSLAEDWEIQYPKVEASTAEEYVLYNYLSPNLSRLIGGPPLPIISRFTGVDYETLLRAENMEIMEWK